VKLGVKEFIYIFHYNFPSSMEGVRGNHGSA